MFQLGLALQCVIVLFGPVIPVFVRRKLLAGQTRGDFPAICAARADAAGPEGVPARVATAHFARADPAAFATGAPLAFGAVDLRLAHTFVPDAQAGLFFAGRQPFAVVKTSHFVNQG